MSGSFRNLVEMIEQSIERHGDQPIFGEKIDGTYRWITYSEFGERVVKPMGGA